MTEMLTAAQIAGRLNLPFCDVAQAIAGRPGARGAKCDATLARLALIGYYRRQVTGLEANHRTKPDDTRTRRLDEKKHLLRRVEVWNVEEGAGRWH